MKTNELRSKSVSDLQNELHELLKEQFSLRMQKGIDMSALKSHHFKRVRREIARIKTILREKASS